MKIKKYLALVLCVILCAQILPVMTFATETEYSISGNGVKVTFDGEELALHRMDGTTAVQMSNPSAMGCPVVNGAAAQDFTVTSCSTQQDITGVMGAGERMTITSTSTSTGLTRTYTLEVSDAEKGVIYTTTSYQAGTSAVTVESFTDNVFEIAHSGTYLWSYNGGGEGPAYVGDTVLKIDLTDAETFYKENVQDYTSAAIPVSDVYSATGGITVGDASATRREVRTPIKETTSSATVGITWPGCSLSSGETVNIGQSFVVVHSGDYYSGLRGYKNAMEYLGVSMIDPSNISDRNYEIRWETWGMGLDWTIDDVVSKLAELSASGVTQITIDDGWYDSAGDWGLDPEKFPNGDADMIRITDTIHDLGMTAILWWRPCDGGREDSTLFQEHPEYFVQNEDGTYGKLDGSGQSGNFFYDTGYALCPSSEGAIDNQTAFIQKAINVWGFDGFKGDYVWSMPKCYAENHNHAYPEESTENQAEFYRTAREAMVACDPDCLTLHCNCGVPQDYYGLQYLTQVATADPTSIDQTRTRAKAYKALMGDYFPVTTDHNDVWYATTVGTGSVMIEKRSFTETEQAEFERWIDISNEVQLQSGRFVGDLYSYGFDPYETYAVEKNGVMFYAFYRDGTKFVPSGNPSIELRGLDADKMYRIVDYVNDTVVATNLMGDEAVFDYQFSSCLLLKAVEITTPDPEVVDPEEGFISVDSNSSELVYTGTWVEETNTVFHNSEAHYTSTAGSSVEFTFMGTGIRWYGQKDTNFGSAEVYLDGQLVETVSVYGAMAACQLLYEELDLEYGTHTIKVVCASPVIDIDRFSYTGVQELTYTVVEENASNVTYSGEWVSETNSVFSGGSAKYTNESNAECEMTFTGTAVRWYGQKDTNFGSADVYIDGVFVETVNVNGSLVTGQMLFEKTDLSEGSHTIRIVCVSPVVDIDFFEYAG